jgi:hypothetical protein
MAIRLTPWLVRTGRDSDRLRIFLVRHGAVDLTQPGFTFPKDCMYGGAVRILSTAPVPPHTLATRLVIHGFV